MIDVAALLARGEAVLDRSRSARLTARRLLQSPRRAHTAKYITRAIGIVCSLCGLPVESRDPVTTPRDDDLVHLTCAFGAARLDRRRRGRRAVADC